MLNLKHHCWHILAALWGHILPTQSTALSRLLWTTIILAWLSSWMQYSDQAEAERASILERFRQASTRWIQTHNADPEVESGSVDSKSCMIVVTDACLPLAASGESPLMARVLINYELPTKKVLCACLSLFPWWDCNLRYVIIFCWIRSDCFFFFPLMKLDSLDFVLTQLNSG